MARNIFFKLLCLFILLQVNYVYTQDSDGDGILDSIDIDDDNDGIIDTYECSAAIQFNNASALTATDLSNVKAGEKVVYSNALLYQNQFYDIVLTIISINGSYTVDCNNELRVSTFNSSLDDYVTYSFDLVEAGSATPADPIGVPAVLYDIILETRDIDTRYYRDFTEIAGFNPNTVTSTVTAYLSPTTNLQQAGFVNTPNPTNYNLYRLDPTLVSPNTDWKYEPDDGGTHGDDPDFYLYLEFDKFSHIDLLYGATGTHTNTGIRLTNFGVSSKCDFDNDNLLDTVDIDSDNDGIPDNVEAQPTIGYIPPSNVSANITDVNGNGLDDVYESSQGGTDLINLEDTDGDGLKDYLDSDTDNDGTPDIQENNHANTVTNIDVDNDGLDDNLDSITAHLDINDEVTTGNVTDLTNSFGDVDSDATLGGDLDYRDLFDINPPVYASIDFDGIDDYLSRSSFIDGLTNVTIMAWVKTDSGNSTNMVIAGEDIGCKLWLENGNTPKFTIKTVGNAETSVSCNSINFDEWHHITATYSGDTGNIYIYVDGEMLNSAKLGFYGAAIENTEDSNGNFEIGRFSSDVANKQYFKGDIDEVRVFNSVLTSDQISKMVYQEIENNAGIVKGKIIDKNINDSSSNATIPWANLIAYYPMTDIKKGTTSDYSSYDKELFLNYITTIQDQTAPMPYTTSNDGDWSSTATWAHGNVWDIENESDNKDWSIVSIKNNITTSNKHTTLGLIIDVSGKLTINGDNELNNSWYLKLDGKIDLQGESQLVQGATSTLDATSSGTLERDQQGTQDLYTYNYWASPVGISNSSSNNNSFTLASILKDGTNPALPININWLTSGYNGTSGSPIGIADYWIWKYANQLSDNYPSWQHVRSTGSLQPGEGFTMKGTADTGGAITNEQNYVFNGKPHNGDVKLTLSSGNDYLIGNPYASAIDADEFILDNISDGLGRASSNIIDGALYFWDHFASSTHNLGEYQGGYATYTLLGGTVAISNDIRINNSGVIGSKKPEQFIPVAQGFFVTADDGGTVIFKNSQRIFKTEASDPSTFLRANDEKGKENTEIPEGETTPKDTRPKIRLMLDSPKGYHRQLLLGADKSASPIFDRGYDAPLTENNNEDLFWIANEKKYIIQAVNNFEDSNVFPLGLKITEQGEVAFKIDELENIPESLDIFVYDKVLNTFNDLNLMTYKINLEAGEYLDRFELIFNNSSLSIDKIDSKTVDIFYSNAEDSIVINNPKGYKITTVYMVNMLGQEVFSARKFNEVTNYLNLKLNKLSTGAYIINVITDKGGVSKKVIVK
jgi:hypothetical protein